MYTQDSVTNYSNKNTLCSVTINREIIVSLFGNHQEEMIKSEDTLTVILIYPHSLFSYFTILPMTAVTFPLRPPRLAFAICGRRWENDVYEIKYSVCGFHINVLGVLLFGSLKFCVSERCCVASWTCMSHLLYS